MESFSSQILGRYYPHFIKCESIVFHSATPVLSSTHDLSDVKPS